MIKQLVFFILFLFTFTTPAMARSYNVDEVQIRAWIQTNGNVLVNEIFHYTFNGEYDHAIRSIHKDGHEGVQNFEAYELMNTSAEPGFVNQNDLQSLAFKLEENTYKAGLSSDDEEKHVFFTYELINAVRSYETYSDLTIPFFGTDQHHNKTLENVTIDIVFPASIEPSQYYAFMHDRFGIVEEKGPKMVRFTTPESPLYSLTEVRVLFPSSMMMLQEKPSAPMTLIEAVEEENTLAQSFSEKEDQKQQLETILKVLSAAASIGVLAVLLLRFRGGPGDASSLLRHDPLYLYMIARNGRTAEYAFLAGLYSLVEREMATVQAVQSKGRFQKDPDAPDETLHFTLTTNRKTAAPCDQKLIKMLFKNRNTFTIDDLAGVTKREKESKKSTNLYSKVRHYREQQQEWEDCAIQEMKNEGIFSSGIPSFLKKLMPLTAYAFILYAYTADSLAASTSIVYGVTALVLLLIIWRKPKKRWPAILFYIMSIIAVAMLYDTDAALWLLLFILLNMLFYALTPCFLLSNEAAAIKSDINNFRRRKSIPPDDLEKWMVRSLLLRTKRSAPEIPVEPAMAATAPLAYLMLTDQEPVNYVSHTWKRSKPPGSSSSSDGGGGFFGDSGSDGGGSDGGGGGGAD